MVTSSHTEDNLFHHSGKWLCNACERNDGNQLVRLLHGCHERLYDTPSMESFRPLRYTEIKDENPNFDYSDDIGRLLFILITSKLYEAETT